MMKELVQVTKRKKINNDAPADEEAQLTPMEEQAPSPESEQGELQDPEQLLEELEKVRQEAKEYLDGWQRSRAELANFRKRVDRERQQQYSRITGDILCRFLGVMDDFERALKDQPQELDSTSWADGIKMIYKKLESILEAEGVEVIASEGEQFNPHFHEAISQEESDSHEEGEIIDVIQRGYQLGDRVIRPAMVRVAK